MVNTRPGRLLAVGLAVGIAGCSSSSSGGKGNAHPVEIVHSASPTALVQLIESAPKVRTFGLRLRRVGKSKGTVLRNETDVATYNVRTASFVATYRGASPLPDYAAIRTTDSEYVRRTGGSWVRILGQTVVPLSQPGAALIPLVANGRISPVKRGSVGGHRTLQYRAVESVAEFDSAEGLPNSASGTVTTRLVLMSNGLPIRVVDVQRLHVPSGVIIETTTRTYSHFNRAVAIKAPARVMGTVHASSGETGAQVLQQALGH